MSLDKSHNYNGGGVCQECRVSMILSLISRLIDRLVYLTTLWTSASSNTQSHAGVLPIAKELTDDSVIDLFLVPFDTGACIENYHSLVCYTFLKS